MRCEDVQQKLELLVYEELPTGESTAAREHVLQCAACRAQFESLQSAKQQLNAWQPIESTVPVGALIETMEPNDAPAVVTTIAAAQIAAKRRRFLPWMIGAAAGLVMAISVLALGAQIKSEDGRLVVSFGRGESGHIQPVNNTQRPARAELTDEQLQSLATMLNQKVNGLTAESLRLMQDQFRLLRGEQDRQLRSMATTLNEVREQDMEWFEQNLQRLAADNQQTKAVLNNVVAALPTEPNLSNGPQTPVRKEIVP